MYNDMLNAEAIEMEWDEGKRQANFEKHGVDFIIASEIFNSFNFSDEDQRRSYGEKRFIVYGLVKGRVMTLVHTHRGNKIRIISFRKSNAKETYTFWQHKRSH